MANKRPIKKKWMPEKENVEFQAPAVPYGSRNLMVENSQDRSSPGGMQPPLPTLDLPNSQNISEMRPDCRSIVHKWYYTGKYTKCTK